MSEHNWTCGIFDVNGAGSRQAVQVVSVGHCLKGVGPCVEDGCSCAGGVLIGVDENQDLVRYGRWACIWVSREENALAVDASSRQNYRWYH